MAVLYMWALCELYVIACMQWMYNTCNGMILKYSWNLALLTTVILHSGAAIKILGPVCLKTLEFRVNYRFLSTALNKLGGRFSQKKVQSTYDITMHKRYTIFQNWRSKPKLYEYVSSSFVGFKKNDHAQCKNLILYWFSCCQLS